MDRVNDLMTWASLNGATLHDRVEVYDDPNYGIAVRVRETRPEDGKLRPKTRIVSCPFNMSLSYLNALDRFPDLPGYGSAPLPTELFRDMDPKVVGNFFLMQQFLTIETSFWAPYIMSLPQPDEPEKLGTPLYFSKEDLFWIQNTRLENAVADREASWFREWNQGIAIILSAPDAPYYWKGAQWEHYKWAATIFSSRSFVSNLVPGEVFERLTAAPAYPSMINRPAPNEVSSSFFEGRVMRANELTGGLCQVLFPLVDLANHKPEAQVTWFTDVQNKIADLSIIIDSELPQGYGFVIEGNDTAAIQFKPAKQELMEILTEHQSHRHSKSTKASDHIYEIVLLRKPASEYTSGIPQFGMFSEGCVDFLALLSANRHEQLHMKTHPEICFEEKSRSSDGGPFSRLTFVVMVKLLQKLKFDLNNIKNGPARFLNKPKTRVQYTALVYRAGEQAVLTAASAALEDCLDEALKMFVISRSKQSILVPSRRSGPSINDNDYVGKYITDAGVQLATLNCAFSFLQNHSDSHYQITWAQLVRVINVELDLKLVYLDSPSNTQDLDWLTISQEGWEFTLWCVWVYTMAFLYLYDPHKDLPYPLVHRWIGSMIEIYNTGQDLDSGYEKFHGEKDEQETLQVILTDTDRWLRLSDSSLIYPTQEQRRRLMNFASAVIEQEGFEYEAMMNTGNGSASGCRVLQRIICLNKTAGGTNLKKVRIADLSPSDPRFFGTPDSPELSSDSSSDDSSPEIEL